VAVYDRTLSTTQYKRNEAEVEEEGTPKKILPSEGARRYQVKEIDYITSQQYMESDGTCLIESISQSTTQPGPSYLKFHFCS